MIELSDLYSDITPELPCGADLEYDAARILLNTSIQGTPEDQFSGQKYEPPNWREVLKQSLDLAKKSKDLQVILYLIRALIHLEGITGFRNSLKYLHQSVSNYWQTIYPLLDPDDGDPMQRLNILEELCSRELLLNPLSFATLAEAKAAGRINLRDIHYATEKLPLPEGASKHDISFIKAVFNETDQEILLANYQAILEAIELLQQIEIEIAGHVGGAGNGVNLEPIKSFLKDMRLQFEEFAGDKLADAGQALDSGSELDDGSDSDHKPAPKARSLGEIATRQDVVKTLDLLCKYYAEHEPSSPVPLLLKRAKTLATANFMEIMQNLLPDALPQIEYIKGPDNESN